MLLCTGGVVTVYSSCVLGCSYYAFYLRTGGAVTMYSNRMLEVYRLCILTLHWEYHDYVL